MNTCEFGQQVSAYADGELSAQESRRVEQHLHTCAVCQRELQDYRRLHGEIVGWKWPEMSQMGIARVRAAIERETAAHLRQVRRVAVGLAGMAACLALVTTVLGNRQGEAPSSVAWETAAVSPARPAEESTEEMAVAQWVLADLGGVDRD